MDFYYFINYGKILALIQNICVNLNAKISIEIFYLWKLFQHFKNINNLKEINACKTINKINFPIQHGVEIYSNFNEIKFILNYY
jgi:hypothetical protein